MLADYSILLKDHQHATLLGVVHARETLPFLEPLLTVSSCIRGRPPPFITSISSVSSSSSTSVSKHDAVDEIRNCNTLIFKKNRIL
jgi:hypothetical protein